MDVIRHDDVFAQRITLPIKEGQSVLDHLMDLWAGQNTGPMAGAEPSIDAFGKIATELLNLAFVVGRRVQCQPAFLLLSECCKLSSRQRVGAMEGHEICRTILAPMRKITPVNFKIGFRIEVVLHIQQHIIIVF